MNTALLPSPHRARLWLAWLPLAIALALNLATLMLRVTVCAPVYQGANFADSWGWLPTAVSAVGFGVLCGLIVTHQPHNRIGWLCGAVAPLPTIIIMLSTVLLPCAEQGWITLPGLSYLGLVLMISPLAISLEFFLLPLVFPNGRFLSAGWRRFALIYYGLLLIGTLITAVWPGKMVNYEISAGTSRDNPFGLPFQPSPTWTLMLQQFNTITWLGGILIANFSLFDRWRRADGQTRQQLKILAYFLVTVGTVFMLIELTSQLQILSFDTKFLYGGWLYGVLLVLLWVGFPVAIGVSVMKYRLYDIDIVIRRTLVYGGLTATLAMIYLGSVLALQGALGRLTGVEDSPLAIVISTLLIAALVTPLRRRIQNGIDRRFYRQKYDAVQALAQFAAEARDETELETLSGSLVSVVEETMQPETISLWLKHG